MQIDIGGKYFLNEKKKVSAQVNSSDYQSYFLSLASEILRLN